MTPEVDIRAALEERAGGGEWVLELDGAEAAKGGILFHYNRPYGDIPSWHLKPGIIWSPENPNSFFPRYTSRLANRAEGILRQAQTRYVMNAAYVRLKNFNIGYNLPSRLTSRVGGDAARIYLAGDNVWTWSPLYKYADNIDVENATAPSDQFASPGGNSGDGYNYPMLKGYTVGMSVTF